MRLLPRSLAGRLLATAAVAIVAALAFASIAIGHVLERFVLAGLDQRLDAQLAVGAQAVRPDGSLDRARAIDVPPFDRPGSGWTWQVRAPGGTLRSASLARGELLPEPQVPRPPHGPIRDDDRPRPFEARTAAGEPIHGRVLTLATAAGPAELVATGPRDLAERPLREAAVPLLLSVLLLGAGLTFAVLIQLRIGLRPLARLQAMLADVREGRRRHVEVDEPSELLPLVAGLNALIDASEAQLAAARLHVANLAHGLKTPLATLRLDLAEPGRDPDGRLGEQVARLEEQVRHHLARARAGDRGAAAMPAVPLAPVLADLTAAMRRLHAERDVEGTLAIPPGLAVRCDPQDLDEALGNLLDNAWRHASHRVSIIVTAEGRDARIEVTDDGTMLTEQRLDALRAGTVRADERAQGYGQGIRIARELVELHGGTLDFARSAPGGLSATVTLRLATI